jgi:putative flippase GtrA
VLLREGARYTLASAIALALDFGCYAGLIRLAGVPYLAAAPVGFVLGLAAVYFLSVRWVFTQRRFADARLEFAAFAAIGLAGLALNQLILYAAIDGAGLGYEAAKIVSAGTVFCFNFTLRKLFLFRRSASWPSES